MKTILPTVFGVLAVLGLLVVFNLIVYDGDIFTKPDNGFLKYFVPISTIIAITIQAILTIPFWKKFKTQGKILGLTLIQFTGFLCIISGLTFGLVFWERSYGVDEFFLVTFTGIITFSVYWTINLLTLRQLDKL